MNDSPMKNYSFGTSVRKDVKRYSWTCKEMGLSYYMEIIPPNDSSLARILYTFLFFLKPYRKPYYQFYIVATEEQFENLRKLLNIRRITNGTN